MEEQCLAKAEEVGWLVCLTNLLLADPNYW